MMYLKVADEVYVPIAYARYNYLPSPEDGICRGQIQTLTSANMDDFLDTVQKNNFIFTNDNNENEQIMYGPFTITGAQLEISEENPGVFLEFEKRAT